jgi:hypothetical protein
MAPSRTPSRPGFRPRRLAAAFAWLSAAALLGACGEQSQHQTRQEPTRTVTKSPPESTPPPVTTTVPAPHHSAAGSPAPSSPGLDPRFRTCKEANAHGYYDYVRGVDPEYYWYIDRDHDGIDCEPGEAETFSPPEPPSSPTEPPSPPTEQPSPPTEEPSTPTEEPPPPASSEPPPTKEPSAPSSGDEQNPPHSSDRAPGGEPFATTPHTHLTKKTF